MAQSKRKSLRATIPAGIVHQLGIDKGWELEWDLRAQNNEIRIIVTLFPPSETAAPSSARKRR